MEKEIEELEEEDEEEVEEGGSAIVHRGKIKRLKAIVRQMTDEVERLQDQLEQEKVWREEHLKRLKHVDSTEKNQQAAKEKKTENDKASEQERDKNSERMHELKKKLKATKKGLKEESEARKRAEGERDALQRELDSLRQAQSSHHQPKDMTDNRNLIIVGTACIVVTLGGLLSLVYIKKATS